MTKLVVYKFDAPLGGGKFELELPVGAKVLSAQSQHDKPVVWVLLDPTATRFKKRFFEWHGTGHPFEDKIARSFISTVQFAGGSYVFHLFDVTGDKGD